MNSESCSCCDLSQCLKDCGCDEEMVKAYFEYGRENKTKEQIMILNRQRKALIADMHKCQKEVDCIDYMICYLEREALPNE